MKCPFCGTDNPAGESFCTNCGGYLQSSVGNAPTIVSGSGSSTTVSTPITTGPNTTGGGSGNSRTLLTPSSHLQNGRYIVDRLLGQGGMGAAALARDTRVSNKLVVIKELTSDSADPAQRQEDVRNFQREVETLANLDHPLVPSVTDSFQEGSRYYMVQDYVAGENLEDRMDRVKQPMPEREALAYASQVLDILEYLEQQKPPIVHRDIKPANIIIGSKDKRAHLVDFGIARADEAKNARRKQTSALGTPGYAPPEQYQGNADGRSDLYALAATIHHIVTNRDPRNYPPFTYPPARSLNPKLSPDIERVLEHALQINVNNRYQNASEMKRDIDGILARRFATAPDTSSYVLSGTSGPIAAAPAPRAQSANPPVPQQRQVQQQRIAPPPPPTPAPRPFQPQPGQYGGGRQQKQKSGGYVLPSFLLLIVVVVIIAAAFFVLPRLRSNGSTGTTTGSNGVATAVPTLPTSIPSNGIGVTTVNGESIGISDGTYAFDTNRPDGSLKQQASAALKSGNSSNAQTLWRSALNTESNDAEALIYLEDQRVLASGSPYVTIVVGTMLTGPDAASTGRDDLQGAYVAQKEYNDGAKLNNGVKVRLLLANSGSNAANATMVAQQIVQAAKQDPTIVGVMGWPFSGQTQQALGVLSNAKIPMISSTASSDALTGASPYFFRVAPSDTSQAGVGARYAQQVLHAKNVAVFEDPANSYSQSLATGFSNQFKANGGTTTTVNYTVGDQQSVANALQQALSSNPAPDLLYFAGYANDVSVILEQLPKNTNFPNLQVLGGDALYELGGYPQSAREGFSRLHFTAFAYPDEWDVLGYGSKKPSFFTDYANYFDPQRQHTGSPYGFTRAAYNVVLSYDAMLALLQASNNVLKSGNAHPTPTDVQQALTQINGANAIQGVSGQISFGSNGDPTNKAVIVLYVSQGGFIQMEPKLGAGTFLVQP
jgi:serine/threonine protein kinase/ABC-type branched-subunit amino acid transport system substrate-binding protein